MSLAPSRSLLRVRVSPRSSRSGVGEYQDGLLHVRVSAPPSEGAANTAVVELLSALCRIPKSQIRIKSGGSSRLKTVEIMGLAQAELERVLTKPG